MKKPLSLPIEGYLYSKCRGISISEDLNAPLHSLYKAVDNAKATAFNISFSYLFYIFLRYPSGIANLEACKLIYSVTLDG